MLWKVKHDKFRIIKVDSPHEQLIILLVKKEKDHNVSILFNNSLALFAIA